MLNGYFLLSLSFLPSWPSACTGSDGQPHVGPVQFMGLKKAKWPKKSDKLCKLNQLSEEPDEHQSWSKERREIAWTRKEQTKRRRTSPLAAGSCSTTPTSPSEKGIFKKGQSKQTSSKVLKVVAGTCWWGNTDLSGLRWAVIHPDSCTWIQKELLRAGRRRGGRKEEAGGATLATLILDNFSYPLIGEIATLGKYGAFDIWWKFLWVFWYFTLPVTPMGRKYLMGSRIKQL